MTLVFGRPSGVPFLFRGDDKKVAARLRPHRRARKLQAAFQNRLIEIEQPQ